MNTGKAIYRIEEKSGTSFTSARRFLTTSGSPLFQLPHLADFYAHCVLRQQPPTLATFLSFGDRHPHTLPTQELTGSIYDNPSDVEYIYYLTMAGETHGLQLLVQATEPGWAEQLSSIVPMSITQANLFAVAACMCDLVSQRAEQVATRNDGVPLPGADPEAWASRAERHRQYQQQLAAGVGASLAAHHLYAEFDAPFPGVQVAGAIVLAYTGRGVLTVSVDLDDTEPWLIRDDGTVPMQITVQGHTVYTG